MSESCVCKVKQDIYCPESATVVRSEAITNEEQFVEVSMDSGKPLGHMPGQFVEVSIPGVGEAPISVSSSPTRGDTFEMVVRKVGNVSNAIAKLEVGEKMGMRGPFGTIFPVDTDMQGKDILFINGGIGLVPVRSAIQYVLDDKDQYGRVMILYGAKSPIDRLFIDEFEEWKQFKDVTLLETVDKRDDSWHGAEGVITTLLPLVKFDPKNTIVIICGPPVMYKFVLMELAERLVEGSNVFVSLERRMKCGVGKCGHCQINGLYACQEGPVFRYSDIENVVEAI